MLKRHRPVSYNHLLLQDSDTESDDNIESYQMATTESRGLIKHGNNPKTIIGGKGKRKAKEMMFNLLSEASEPFSKSSIAQNFDPEVIVELAKQYQKQMKKTPIPRIRLTHSVVMTWEGLAKTLKNLYGQPLHYLTHMLCKQWDKSRAFGSDNADNKPLDTIFNGTKAEATIWEIESVHRLSTSHVYLANLWLHDPQFYSFVDEVLPISS